MKSIVAFGASTSRTSINSIFARYAAEHFRGCKVEFLDLNDFPVPLFSVDLEKESGIAHNAIVFYEKLRSVDLIIISLAEHNGSYTAAFKNLFDWMSRYKSKFFEAKSILLLSTSPGPRAGRSVMEAALNRFPRHGAIITGHFSLPEFEKNFDSSKGITDNRLRADFEQLLKGLKKSFRLPK